MILINDFIVPGQLRELCPLEKLNLIKRRERRRENCEDSFGVSVDMSTKPSPPTGKNPPGGRLQQS